MTIKTVRNIAFLTMLVAGAAWGAVASADEAACKTCNIDNECVDAKAGESGMTACSGPFPSCTLFGTVCTVKND